MPRRLQSFVALCIEAAAGDRVVERSLARPVSSGLRVDIGRRRPRHLAPRIQGCGHVCNAIGTFAQPQQQVVVLRTVETFAKSAEFVEQAPPHDQQMGHIVERE